MSVQIIKQEGKPAFAVIPYRDYLDLIRKREDAEDIAAVAAYLKNTEELMPDSVVEALLNGENPIKVYRRFRQMTQGELADGIKKSKAYVAKLEAGDRKGTTEVISNIAAVLNVDIDDLITIGNQPNISS